jgi:adenylosuccinate synthase
MRKAVITIGLGFGDCAKGATTDFLCRQLKADLVVRYCGGCQAAHNVHLPDGTCHTFSQFGSGTFFGVPTYLGPAMIISPIFMANEAAHLESLHLEPYELLSVDKDCIITTQYHITLNRYRETQMGDRRHGSCGLGIGATREFSLRYPSYALRIGDIPNRSASIRKLEKIQRWVQQVAGMGVVDHISPNDIYEHLSEKSERIHIVDEMPNFDTAVFEGAQGILLDENYGYSPYITWSTVTLKHAGELLRKCEQNIKVSTVGCIRPYFTRHGAGPLLYQRPTMLDNFPNKDRENRHNEWQGTIRYGLLDFNTLSYAKAVLGGELHGISLSCADHIGNGIDVFDIEEETVTQEKLVEKIERALAPVSIIGTGPCHIDRHMTELSWRPLEEAIK